MEKSLAIHFGICYNKKENIAIAIYPNVGAISR